MEWIIWKNGKKKTKKDLLKQLSKINMFTKKKKLF